MLASDEEIKKFCKAIDILFFMVNFYLSTKRYNNNTITFIGYWISSAYNGKGFISRAVKIIEKQAFNCGIHRLVITVQKDNTPSSRVAERNNYILEGVLHDALYKYDRYFDAKIYAKINNS